MAGHDRAHAPGGEPAPPERITVDDYDRLIEHGVLGKVEMLDGTVYMAGYPMQFSLAQRRAASSLGVELPDPDSNERQVGGEDAGL